MRLFTILIGLAVCAAFPGCSRKAGGGADGQSAVPGSVAQQQTLPENKRATLGGPSMANALEQMPPKERAAKIREYKEKGFDKKILKGQLARFANDPDPEVAQAVKEATE